MLWISHRGNLNGPNPYYENTIFYINTALNDGVNVEVDVWYVDGKLKLGHDVPGEEVPQSMLNDFRIWFHCKNGPALEYLQNNFTSIKYFWHQTDDYTIVSNGRVWVYPGKQLLPGSIAVMPEISCKGSLMDCYAICTDCIVDLRNRYENSLLN